MEYITNMQTAEALLKRFYRFYDGLIKTITIELNGLNHDITIEIVVKDSTISEDNYYVQIRITFDKVNEYCIRYGLGGYIYVLSFGAAFTFQPDGTFFCRFSR